MNDFINGLKGIGSDVASIFNPYATSGIAAKKQNPTPIVPSNPSAVGTISKPMTTNQSLSTPAAQNYMQSQIPSPSGLNDVRDSNGMLTNPGGASYDRNTGQSLNPPQSNYSATVNDPVTVPSPYADYVKSLQSSRDAINNATTALAGTNSKIFTSSLNAKQQYENTLNAPGGTVAGAQQSATLEDRHNNANLANLAAIQNAQANTLGAAQANYNTKLPLTIGNANVDPTTGQILSNKPEQITPGSGLFNTATGEYSPGSGASPSTITSYAQTLKENDQMTGNLHLTPQGTVDDNYYYQQASSVYGGQGASGDGSNGSSGGNNQVPQQVQTYLNASGGQYINADKVPANQQDLVKQLAAQNGVPYLESGQVGKLQSIDVTNDNLSQLSNLLTGNPSTGQAPLLQSGLAGSTIGALWNQISQKLQLNPNLSSFNAYRDTAINTIQALAGGTGSGLRLNAGEINTAIGNLPTINDNLETASKKIALVQGFMNKWKNEILTGSTSSSENNSGSSTSSGGWSSLGD